RSSSATTSPITAAPTSTSPATSPSRSRSSSADSTERGRKRSMRIVVVGTGYVGLVAGVCFADSGHAVVCVDVDAAKIDALKKGEAPIYEPGLEELLHKNIAAERVSFSTALAGGLPGRGVVVIAGGP